MSDDERELVGRLFELVDAPFHGALRALLSENDALKADLIAAQGYRAAAEEIAQRRGEMVDALIAERDEARRKWCELASAFSASIITAEGLAKERGWDCFDAKEVKP